MIQLGQHDSIKEILLILIVTFLVSCMTYQIFTQDENSTLLSGTAVPLIIFDISRSLQSDTVIKLYIYSVHNCCPSFENPIVCMDNHA